MNASIWYVGVAPYFSRSAALAASKACGLPVVPMAVCPACDGNGPRDKTKCEPCNGTGEVKPNA